MCGIVGYIGSQKAKPILINGLLKLEYRGYDSAGLSTIEKTGVSILKEKGRVANLENLSNMQNLEGTVGIAHTRWATHGKPSQINSHPHMDAEHIFSVVHNGIIENYLELKEFLKEQGFTFVSETDTEVIPNLISYYFKQTNEFLEAVSLACNDLKGSYAICVISAQFPDTIIVTRKDSPLVVGKGEHENYISSDIPAILSFTKDFYLLNDNEYAVLSRDAIDFYDKSRNKINKEVKNISWDSKSAEKGNYEHFMLKEIYEQPTAILQTIGTRLPEHESVFLEGLELSREYLKDLNKIYIVACGTAMHAGLVGKNMIEKLCAISTSVEIASEFRYSNPLVDEKSLAIFISQSGETADTIAALKLAKSKGAKTIAISNVIGSSITREADFSLYTHAGPEIAVASTKAYTSQIVLLSILSLFLAENLESSETNVRNNLKEQIRALPNKVNEILEETSHIQDFAKRIYQEHDIFFIGRGIDYFACEEGCLKLKEISYIHSESYPSGELKHGTIALIEHDITVISILTDSMLLEKSMSNIQEVVSRGAKILTVTNQKLQSNNFDTILSIPEVDVLLSPVLSVIPLQLLAYYVSKEKGLDVDKPRNLAKSVTVE